jgi:hypothetical protein
MIPMAEAIPTSSFIMREELIGPALISSKVKTGVWAYLLVILRAFLRGGKVGIKMKRSVANNQ